MSRIIWVSFQIDEDLAGPILADLADRDVQNLSFGLVKKGRSAADVTNNALKPNGADQARQKLWKKIMARPNSHTARTMTAIEKHPEGLSRNEIREIYAKFGGNPASVASLITRLINGELMKRHGHDCYIVKGF